MAADGARRGQPKPITADQWRRAVRARDKILRGESVSRHDASALKAVERADRERHLSELLDTGLPKGVFCELAGRQQKVVDEMLQRYGLAPTGRGCGGKVSLGTFIKNVFDLLASRGRVLLSSSVDNDDDALLGTGESEWLERYRKERTLRERLKRHMEDGSLVRREWVDMFLAELAARIRELHSEMQRQFGREAGSMVSECVGDIDENVRRNWSARNDDAADDQE